MPEIVSVLNVIYRPSQIKLIKKDVNQTNMVCAQRSTILHDRVIPLR